MRVEKVAEGFGDVQFVLERGKERPWNQAMIRSPHFRLRGSTDAPSLVEVPGGRYGCSSAVVQRGAQISCGRHGGE